MNFKQLFLVAVLIVTGVTWSFGDTGTVAPKKVAPLKKSDGAEPVDRKLEIRLGPRISFVTGDVRYGVNGTTADIWDDLGLKDPNPGIQFDVDWQPWNRWHFSYGMTWDNYNQSGTTSKVLTKDGGDTILAGAQVDVNLNLFTFDGRLGYDVIKTSTYRLTPYIGGKGGYITGTVQVDNTHYRNRIGATVVPRYGTNKWDDNNAYGTFFGGIDQRVYITRGWYVGADAGAFGLSNWYYINGDGYTGYDFNKSWGIRIGYKADYVNYESGKNANTIAQPLLGAAYVQAVYGF